MADVPRDPRQLARDILSGKVRIEDLARERQMRAGGGGGIKPVGPAARAPERIPLPRQAPLRPVPPARPVQRIPVPPVRRPVLAPPANQTPRMPMPVQQSRVVRAAPVMAPAVAKVVASRPPAAEPPRVGVPRRRVSVRDLVRSRTALRQGIVMAEVLGTPVGLRDME